MKLIFLAVAVVGLVLGVALSSHAMISGICKALAGVGFIGWFILQVFGNLWNEKPMIPGNSTPPKNHH